MGALILAGAFAGTIGCSESDSENEGGLPESTSEAISTYSDIVHASYEDSLEVAMLMDAAIQEFLDDPSEDTLDAAKQSWLDAREPYLQTEVYRFYDGPIDNPEDGPEGMINAWPLDERYIDYTVDDPESGIINDPDLEISADSLMQLNEQGGEKNIATGYHAIEFLLWGEDRSEDGPGDRSYTDYLEDGGAPNADRRGLYLRTVSALLVEHLETLVAAWAADEENYRADFESIAPEQALGRILTGMINLSGFETGGERLQAALDTGLQEDEHSCFSDNTHRDMIQDIQGVLNVWQGRYVRSDDSEVTGVSIHSIVREVDADQAEEIDTRIRASLELAKDLRVPFDREIASDNEAGNERVSQLVTSLKTVDAELERAFETLGLGSTTME
ncbi:MAG TPA: imelysin family protein [Polyangiaceae bacterium]